jgi:uncharacterized hydrophobic protein (TIGR00271 family)
MSAEAIRTRRAERLSRRFRSRRRFWNQWAFDPEPEIAAALEAELYFEGARRGDGISRYFTLLTLATLIAGFGLYADSLAVVVAAMLVAPLMTPIMGLALALVCGFPYRQINSAILIAISIVVVVLLGWLIGEMLPSAGPIQQQLIARTEPRLIDLSIAIASGAAGAYALVRREAAAALPGVSIGISLVPPLTTTGMLLARDESDLAIRSFELFLINLTAIVLVGSIVFSLLGFLPVHNIRRLPVRIRVGLLMAAIAMILVAIPLIPTSARVLNQANEQNAVGVALSDWVASRPGTEVVDYTLTTDDLIVSLTGTQIPDDIGTLREDLRTAVNRDVQIEVRFYPYTPVILTRGLD